ncbi:hypothetical protein AURDEDRAFT_112049, partial [Auricularia subglabra TFB-10046 SS5]
MIELQDIQRWYHDWIIPYPADRTPVTPWNFWILLTPFAPLLTVSYLARRPNTWALRLLVFPLVLLGTTRVFFAYYFTPPGANEYNWALGLLGIYAVSRAVEFSFTPRGRFKIGEKVLGAQATPAVEREQSVHKPHRSWGAFVGLRDAIELLCAVRGIGWDFGSGTGLHVPTPTRPLERSAFLRATIRSTILSFLVLDHLEAFLKLWPGVNQPAGGSIFYADLPPLERYAVSTTLHTCTGFAFLAGFQMCYDLLTLIAVTFLRHSPESWPPVWDEPWKATSLHEFWARRWHQLLRQTFLVCGGYPLGLLFGRVGIVLGSFAASGAFHDLGMYAMGNGLDGRVFMFFFIHGLLVIGENIYRKITGHRVGGWPGRLWVYFTIFVLGQPLVDSWHRRGLAGGLVIPSILSPARLVTFPLVKRLWLSLAA